MHPYSAADRQRLVVEDPKRAQLRSESESRRSAFQRDRARVLHSYAFRRLADKTQVVSPGGRDDFPRTRLTHSLEVAQISREMGEALGCDPDVCDTAGLAHDLGHPPFGHNGEDALNAVAASFGGFEGNAQTLRIVTRLEPKIDQGGLNLTRATLDAVCKYPWPAGAHPADKSVGKFGVYDDDLPAFRWLRDGRVDGQRCLEAQVMDWADDVAYSVHDVEDGVHSGHIRLLRIDAAERAELCRQAAELYSPLPPPELAAVLDRLLELPALLDLAGYDGSYLSQAAAKRATSELTGRFVGAAVAATQAKFGTEPLGRYAASLIVPGETAAECALLKAIAYRYVMRRDGVDELLQRQRDIVTTLVQELFRVGDSVLSTVLRDGWRQAETDDQRLRLVVDQVAQLTDSAAIHWYERLTGNRVPSSPGPAE